MPAKPINRQTQRQIAALLSQAAQALAGAADPALVESLQQQAVELDSRQAETAPASNTVSLKYAHRQLCALSYLDGARIVTGARLAYDGQPIWVIYDDLQRLVTHAGEQITGLAPTTRLERLP
jgi:hypothetical protein